MKGELRAVVDAFAQSIIKSVMDERKMGAEDFHKSRRIQHIKARAAAIRRLNLAGFPVLEIARAMKITRQTVCYRLNPEYRESKLSMSRKCRSISAARALAARVESEARS